MRSLSILLAGMSLILVPAITVAAEFTAETDSAIEACVTAAVDKLPGIVTGWRIDGATIRINVLATNNRIWELGCTNGAIVSEKSTNGSGEYQTVRARVMASERLARQTAAATYPKGDLFQMKYGRAWKGKIYYTYTLRLPDGREATVQVNSATGRVDETSTERK
jgi:hypothetical protein